MTTDAAIHVLGLQKSFKDLHVLRGVDFDVAPGTIFALFAGVYYWYPKVTGRKMNEALGKIHFFFSFIFMNGVFMPMFIQGLAGVSRRLFDGGFEYPHAEPVIHWNRVMSMSAWLGVGSPEGWLCTRMTAEALSSSARFATSRG